MFRKTINKGTEDEISADLLDAVPELDGESGGFSGFIKGKATDVEVPFTVLVDDDSADPPPAPAVPLQIKPFPLGGGAVALEPPAQKAKPQSAPAPRPAAPPPAATDVDAATLALDVHALVRDARKQMDAAFQNELTRVESAFGGLLEQMEARLAQAELELAAVRAEHDKVKRETDRKVEALRELKKALEGI